MQIDKAISRGNVLDQINLAEQCIGDFGAPKVAVIGNWNVSAYELTTPGGNQVVEAFVSQGASGKWDTEPRRFESRAEYMEFLTALQQNDLPPFPVVSANTEEAA